MSAETSFRAALAARAQLTALVGTRIALNAVPEDEPMPLVVFGARHDPERSLDGTLIVDQVTFTVQCWGRTAAEAAQVADEVEAAINAHDAASTNVCTWVESRADGHDGDLGLDAQILTVMWHQQ